MVFPGRFSTGCMRCRQRKVKCDETKPSCRRCYIYGKPCPGYTDQFHFRRGLNSASFASNTSPKSNTSASSASPPQQQPQQHPPPSNNNGVVAAQHRRGSNSSEETNADANWNNQQLVATQSHMPPHMQDPSILLNPDISYDHVSLCYFVRRFVSPDGADSFPGHLTFLPDLFNHHGQGILETATLSVAQMAAYNQFGGDKFKMESYRNYGRAIRSLQESIMSPEATDDRVLTAILLLCTFKDISGEGVGDPSDHAAGIYYILEKRGFEQLATRRGFELFLLSLLRLQVYSFLHDDDTYCDPGGLTALLGLIDPLMRAMNMVSKTLQLRHALARCGLEQPIKTEEGSSPQESVHDPEVDTPLIQECFQFLDEFTAWDSEAASYWKNTFDGRVFPSALGEPAAGFGHYDPETACIIILVRCSRLILLMSMLEYRDRMELITGGRYSHGGIGAQWVECVPALENDIRSTIDDMISCVPYALGDLDPKGQRIPTAYDGAGALVIVQPMRLVTFCRHAKPHQVQAAQAILSRINTTMGIKSAIPWMGEDVLFGFTSAECRQRLAGRATSIASTDRVSTVPSPLTS